MKTLHITILAAALAAVCGCATSQPATSQETGGGQSAAAQQCLKPLKVGVYADRGPGGIGAIEWFRLVEESPEMELKLLDGKAVRAGGLDGLDLLVMPGGSSKTEFTSLGTNGVNKMKEFIRNGGGYIGTCAGCCLLMDGPDRRARMMPWNTAGSEGLLVPSFELNEKGAKALGLKAGKHKMRYHGGPFMWPTTNVIADAKMESWGTFSAEACLTGKVNSAKRMYGATAIVGGTYGKGKVFVTSAHPEYFDSTLYIVKAAFKFVTGRDVTFPARLRKPRAISVGFIAKGISGIETAETALALAAEKDFDLVLIDMDGIFQRKMDNVDVLVVTSDASKKSAPLAAAINDFAARGGKVVGYGTGKKALPEGGVACDSRQGVVKAIKELFASGCGR